MFRSHPIPEPPAPIALGTRPRILVVKLASLGDALLAMPALRALRHRYPLAELDVLTTQASAALLRESPLVDQLFTFDKYAFDEPLAALRRADAAGAVLALGRRLRRRRYDAALLLHHLTLPFGRVKYRALLSAVGAGWTVGLDNGWGSYFDVGVPDQGFGWRHEAEYNLMAAQAVGADISAQARGPHPSDLGWGDIAHRPEPDPLVIALHPGGGAYSVARRWPLERWADLAGTMHEDYAASITLIGGADERDLLQGLQGRLGSPPWLSTADTSMGPRELAKTFSKCSLLIANDSFPMHVAAMVGTPVVAVFGPSNARAWGPYVPDDPQKAIVIQRTDLPCCPCFYRGHALGTPQGCPARPCLTELPLQPVLAAAHRLLAPKAAGAGRGG